MPLHQISDLSPAIQRSLVDFLAFLDWSERPFRVMFEDLYPLAVQASTVPRRSLSGFLADILIVGCILRGAMSYARVHGIACAWLRLALFYRTFPPQTHVSSADLAGMLV